MKYRGKSIWIDQRETEWFSTDELLEYLGITRSELDQQCQLFIEGVHYKKNKPAGNKASLVWRLDLIDELLCLPIPPLEKEVMLNAINNHITCNTTQ